MKPGKVGMYTCGPTVYNFAHIGNLRTYAFEDVLRRYLKYKGFEVKQVMNITDVDDKIIRAIRESGVAGGVGELISNYTTKYTQAFFDDIDALNIERAEVYPHASQYIDEMVKIIKILLAKGIAYKGDDGSVYYSIAKFPGYGKLAHVQIEDLKVGARVKHDEYEKENLSDFALWKAWDEADGDVFWETELGKGRPGWHIECSAMSSKLLGKQFDIHTGGVDNLFPHHENEIAQSEGAFGGKFVNYWLHSEHLLVDGTKMAKSKHNFYTLKDILDKGYSPLAVRYLYVTSDYRKKLDFSFENLDAAGKALDRIYQFIKRVKDQAGQGASGDAVDAIIEKSKNSFIEALDDDLNAPSAMAAIFTLITDTNRLMDAGNFGKDDSVRILDFMFDVDRIFSLKMEEALVDKELAEEVKKLIEERKKARKEKNFALSDKIRDDLKSRGIELMDTPQGTTWRMDFRGQKSEVG